MHTLAKSSGVLIIWLLKGVKLVITFSRERYKSVKLLHLLMVFSCQLIKAHDAFEHTIWKYSCSLLNHTSSHHLNISLFHFHVIDSLVCVYYCFSRCLRRRCCWAWAPGWRPPYNKTHPVSVNYMVNNVFSAYAYMCVFWWVSACVYWLCGKCVIAAYVLGWKPYN